MRCEKHQREGYETTEKRTEVIVVMLNCPRRNRRPDQEGHASTVSLPPPPPSSFLFSCRLLLISFSCPQQDPDGGK